MSRLLSRHKVFFRHKFGQLLFIAAFAAVGTYLLTNSYASTSQVAEPANFYGMNWHPNWINAGAQDAEMDLMKQAGVGSVRIDAEWYFLEQSQGVYQATYMARLDHAIDGLKARGIEPLVVITSTPKWVSNAPAGDPDVFHEPPLRTTIDASCNSSQTICSPFVE